MKVKAILFLVLSCVVASAPANVPMRMAETIFSSYYYGDYDLPTNEISRSDWWGTVEYDLENEATSPDAAGTFIALDDADDLSWEYYSNTDIPVHSNGAVNIVVKYYGCGKNMKDNVEVTDLGISPVVANDGGDNVKAIFYRKTIEKENAGDTYYIYTTIPNPFSRRPVRTDTDVMTGANCKFLGFYGWAAEYSDCSLAYADGTSFDENAYADNIVLPGKKLKVTVTGENPTITFKALWDQCVVQTVVGSTVTTTGLTTVSNNIDRSSLYERQYIVNVTTAGAFTAPNYPATYSQLYPDGTDGGLYESGSTVTSVTPSKDRTVDNKFEYMNFTGTNLQKIEYKTNTSNTTDYIRFVIGRGMVMPNPVNFNGIYQNNSVWNLRLAQGLDVRVESGNYTHIYGLSNTYGWDSRYVTTWVNVANAINRFTLGSDYDRWKNDNTKLIVSNEVHMTHLIRFATQAPMFDASIKSGTFGTSAADEMNFGMYLLNQAPVRGGTDATYYPYGILYAGRNVVMEGGVVNSSIYGGRDENILYTGTSASLSFNSAGYTIANGTLQDISSLYYTFKMKGGTLNGDFYGGDNVRFSESGTNRMEITAQPRRIAFVGGTVNGSVYGGSKYDDASSATTLTNGTHMSALALTDVNMYIGGDATINASTELYGGDNNTANTSVKTLHSVRDVDIVIADGKNIAALYGGGSGAGLGKDYEVNPSSSAVNSQDPKSDVNICLKDVTVASVYGGIKGDSYADQIMGSSNITINGGIYTNVYGGGYGTNSEIQGSTTVTLNSGNVTNVYGGGNQGNVGQFANDVAAVNINGGTVGGNVYGGGYQGITYGSPAVNIKGGSVSGDVYGGADGGDVYQDIVYTYGVRTVNVADNAKVSGNVYAGSRNSIDMYASTEKTDVTLSSSQNRDFGLYHRNGGKGFNAALINSNVVGSAKMITSLSFPFLMSSWNSTWNSTTYFPVVRTIRVYLYNINSESELLTQSDVLKVNDATGECYMQFNTTAASSSASQANLDWKVDAAHKVFDGDVTINYHDEAMVINLDNAFLYDGTSHLLICIETSGSTKSTIGSSTGTDPSLPILSSVVNETPHKYGSMVIGGGNNSITNWETTEPSGQTLGGTYTPVAQIPVVYFGSTPAYEFASKVPAAFANITKGNIGGSVYGSGNNNKMYGGCYVNIGADAVANAPGHEANVNVIENPATGAITIGGSVYAGSDYGSSAWAYTDANRSVSGVSEVYLDGTGYSDAITIGGSKDATTGNIYGCSTNGEGGKLGSSVYISNIGSRNAQGKELSSTSWAVNSVQHADTLVLNNAHVTFNGAEQIEDDTKTNSVYGVHKTMRVVNNSTVLLKADADSIAKVGSYQCTDVYDDNPVYTEVTAVEGASGKTQLTDCKNTIVFTNGANLYVRSMESGTETYGELQGYLYAQQTDEMTTAIARARQKQTDNSGVTSNGTDNASDGGFVSYYPELNVYDNPTGDGYLADNGMGGKQEVGFKNWENANGVYRDWRVQKPVEVILYAEKTGNAVDTYTAGITVPASESSYQVTGMAATSTGVYPAGIVYPETTPGLAIVSTAATSSFTTTTMGLSAQCLTSDNWSSETEKSLHEVVNENSYETLSATASTDPATLYFNLYFDGTLDYPTEETEIGYAIMRLNASALDNQVVKVIVKTRGETQEPHLWTEFVTDQPATWSGVVNDTLRITCAEDLAWLISYVNGYNDVDGGAHDMQGQTVVVTEHLIDMYDHVWVPIGFDENTPFKGTFDGGCNVLNGIHVDERSHEASYVEDKYGPMMYAGIFGYTEGATVKNTFLLLGDDGTENCENDWITCKQAGGYLGGLVGYGKDLDMEFCGMTNAIGAFADLYSMGGLVGYATSVSYHAIKACYSNPHLCFYSYVDGEDEYYVAVEYSGGLVGYTNNVAVENSFSMPVDVYEKYTILDPGHWHGLPSHIHNKGAIVGGASSASIVSNVYAHPFATVGFDKIVGDIVGTISDTKWYAVDTCSTPYTNVATFTTAKERTYGTYSTNNTVNGTPLCDVLNSNIADGYDYKWMTPPSTSVNGGYPLIVRSSNQAEAVFSAQTVGENFEVLLFHKVNEMPNLFAVLFADEDGEGGKVNEEKEDGGEIGVFMYSSGEVNVEIPADINFFIDENVALMQGGNDEINAVVGITLDNSAGNGEMSRDWHFFSPSIAGGKTGVNYGTHQSAYTAFNTGLMTFGTDGDWDYNLIQGDETVYFPDGITTAISEPGKQFDLYSFYEPEYHWINLKRASGNHWHEDEIEGTHPNIAYTNETEFTPGKGYMIALGNNTTADNNLMQAKGVLNSGHVTVPVTAEGEHLTGYNLIGNPYQSYLDFNKFANANKNLWASSESIGYKSYLIYNADKGGFVEYLVDDEGVSFSQGAAQDGDRYINMHQGFFVVKNGTATEAVFEDTMRVTNQTPHFRDELPAYPLVNLFCTDSDGKQEVSVIEFERPEAAGSLKMKGMLNGKGNMYVHWGSDDFGSVFIDHMPDFVPVWFDAAEDGVFTMTWNTANAHFGYMHLIDNMTGVDYDCLANDSYTFNASVNDMSARFRLVFKPLGIEEETTENGENFAFINGNELVVNGEGELSLIDLNGRVLATEYVSGQQSHITMPDVAEGMYMLRLTKENDVRVQKIVIRK